MRASCNGCRVLRKGCKDGCELRASLQWIRTSHAQANATVFLAKFYGRAGLINLINSGPPQQRSTIFKSLLYEACGRTVDPVFGSLGLLCSGNWHLCHAAVQAVLEGYTFPSIISPSPPQGMMGEDFGKAKVSKVGNKNGRFKHSKNKARKERSSQIECVDNDTMKGSRVSADELVDNHGSCGENMGLELELSLSSCVTSLNNHGLTFNGLNEHRA